MYCKRKTLCFLFTEGASSTTPGEPYRAKWKDENGNSRYRDVPRPQCCSTYFIHSNVIDVLNMQRQKELRLEKFWVTEDGYFRIITSVFGICVVDCWNAYKWHLPDNHRHKHCDLETFYDMMALDLLNNEESSEIDDGTLHIPLESAGVPGEDGTGSERTGTSNIPRQVGINSSSSPGLSSVITTETSQELRELKIQNAVNKHRLIENNETVTERRAVANQRTGSTRFCNLSRKRRFECSECKLKNVDKPKKRSTYCAECKPMRFAKKYWLCESCLDDHRKRICSELRSGL